jgi:outer membrane cobalamin receptor
VRRLVPGVQGEGPHNQRDRVQQVRIRGFEPEYTLVLLDGERAASRDARGTFDLSAIPAESIERIDVVRGPLALLLGGDAIGGTVDVVTAGPVRELGGQLSAGYGSFDTYGGHGRLALPWTGGSLSLFSSAERSDGWSDEYELDRTLRRITSHEDARGTFRTENSAALTLSPAKEHELNERARLPSPHRAPRGARRHHAPERA